MRICIGLDDEWKVGLECNEETFKSRCREEGRESVLELPPLCIFQTRAIRSYDPPQRYVRLPWQCTTSTSIAGFLRQHNSRLESAMTDQLHREGD
jgi:hypothetical protein